MTRNDLRIAWRLLLAEPAYSAVVIAGLTLGFAASFLLLGFVRYSFSYDSQAPDNAHVYVFKHRLNLIPNARWTEMMPLPVRDVLLASGLPLTVCAVMPRTVVAQSGAHRQKIELTVVDASFPAMFGVRVLAGDMAAALSRPDGLAVTRSGAAHLFADGAALGRSVDIDGQRLTVRALLADAPSNTTVPYEYLTGVGSRTAPHGPHLWNSLAGKMFVRAGGGITPEALQQLVQTALDHSPLAQLLPGGVPAFAHVADVGIGRLRDAYFDIDVAAFHGGVRGDRATVLGLAALALLIVLLAAINYVNLATVRMLRRQREIGLRKALGATPRRLALQFVAESALAALIAAALGVLLAWLLLPAMSELLERRLDGLFTPAAIALALMVGLLVGAASALYPAAVALGVRPAAALSGRDQGETPAGLWLRRALTTLQLGAAIALTAAALAVSWQTRYASLRDPGFDPARLMLIDLPRGAPLAQIASLRAALAQLPQLDGVAVSDLAIGSPELPMSTGFTRDGGRARQLNTSSVSANFFALYGLSARAGRAFDARRDEEGVSHAVMLNEAALRALGYADAQAALGQRLNHGYYEIIGIAPALRHQSLRQSVQPYVYTLDTHNPGVLTLRSDIGAAALYQAVALLWQRYFPADALTLHPAGAVFADNYREDARLAALLGGASLLAAGIAAFGVYVLAAYSVRRRRREIALRKLHGASRRAIAALVGREFVLLVGVAAALALPCAALAIERYLSGYVERAPLGAWPLLAALGLAAAVAALASWRHTASALRIAPAQALRDD